MLAGKSTLTRDEYTAASAKIVSFLTSEGFVKIDSGYQNDARFFWAWFTSFGCNSEVGKNPAADVVQFNSFQSRNILFSFSNQNFSKIFFKNNISAAVYVYYSYRRAVNSMYKRKDTPSNPRPETGWHSMPVASGHVHASILVLLVLAFLVRVSVPVEVIRFGNSISQQSTYNTGVSLVWLGRVKVMLSLIVHFFVFSFVGWNTHPSREGLPVLAFFETSTGWGLFFQAIVLADVMVYLSYCNWPMTATPISVPSLTASGLLPVPLLGLNLPRLASAEAAVPLASMVPRAAWATSAEVIPFSTKLFTVSLK